MIININLLGSRYSHLVNKNNNIDVGFVNYKVLVRNFDSTYVN